jgi:protein O-mannosyl-transferase
MQMPKHIWILAVLLLPAVTVAAYIPALQAEFIFDDDTLLAANPLMRDPGGIWKFWWTTPRPETPDYWPMTSTTLWLEYQLWGLQRPWGYHLTNILLHAVGALLIWRVLVRLRVPGAYAAALLFALHPVCVGSVAWVSERKNVLSMVFYALTILAYLRYDDDGKRTWYAVAIAAFALALLSKTSGVLLPVALGVLIWWRRGTFGRRDAVRLAPLLGLSVAMGVVTVLFQHQMPMGYEHGAPYSLADRLVASGAAVWFYLYKALVPIRLAIVYPRWEIGAAHALGWLSVGGATGLLIWQRRKRWARAGLAAGAWFLLMLLPALGLVRMRWMVYSLVADHFQYLALPAAGAVVVAALWTAMRRLPEAARLAIVTLPAIACGALTFLHAGDYKDTYTLWTDVTETYPSISLAHHNRGPLLEARGEHGLALEAYRTALVWNPESATTHASLSATLFEKRDYEGALRHGRRAIELRAQLVKNYPDIGVPAVFAEAENTVGSALLETGQAGEALSHFNRAIKGAPDLSVSYSNAGWALILLRQPAAAEAKLRRAVQLRPDHIEPVYNLGLALHAQGKLEEALQWFRRALVLDPNHPRANNNAGATLGALGRTDEAIQCFRNALRVDPNNVKAKGNLFESLFTLGRNHMSGGRFARAAECFQQASAMKGHREPVLLDALAAALAEMGRFEEAVKVAERALELATAAKLTALMDGVRKRLALYKAGQTYREPPATPAP